MSLLKINTENYCFQNTKGQDEFPDPHITQIQNCDGLAIYRKQNMKSFNNDLITVVTFYCVSYYSYQ